MTSSFVHDKLKQLLTMYFCSKMGNNPVRTIALSCDSRILNQNPDCPTTFKHHPTTTFITCVLLNPLHFFFCRTHRKCTTKSGAESITPNDAMAAIASVTNSGRVPLVVVDEPIAVGTREIPRAFDRKLMTDWPSGNSQPATPLAAIVPLCCCCCGGH